MNKTTFTPEQNTMEKSLQNYPYLNEATTVYVPKYCLNEILSKYWYEKEYDKIDMKDGYIAAEKSRADFNKWADENLPLFSKESKEISTTKN